MTQARSLYYGNKVDYRELESIALELRQVQTKLDRIFELLERANEQKRKR